MTKLDELHYCKLMLKIFLFLKKASTISQKNKIENEKLEFSLNVFVAS